MPINSTVAFVIAFNIFHIHHRSVTILPVLVNKFVGLINILMKSIANHRSLRWWDHQLKDPIFFHGTISEIPFGTGTVIIFLSVRFDSTRFITLSRKGAR